MPYNFTHPSPLRKYNPINASSMKEAIIIALKKYYIIDKGFPEREILSNLNKLIKVVETDLNNNKYSLIYSPGTGNRDFNDGGKESQEKNEFKPKFSEPEKKANQKLIRKHGVDSFKNYIGGRYQKPVKESTFISFKEYFLSLDKSIE